MHISRNIIKDFPKEIFLAKSLISCYESIIISIVNKKKGSSSAQKHKAKSPNPSTSTAVTEMKVLLSLLCTINVVT